MRTRRLLALALVLALAPAGCARGPDDDGANVATARSGAPRPSSSGPTGEPDRDAPVKFAQCMREHGMTWFPDPQPDGRMTIKTPKGLDPKKMDAAQQACRQFAPNGGPGSRPDPAAIEQARQMAKCMRANGVPNFPDPNPDGGLGIDRGKLGTGPGEPTFDRAEQACARYLPPKGGDAGRNDTGGKVVEQGPA